MAFKKFTESARSYAPKVSIRSTGSLGFNFGCVRKFGIEKFTHAVLYYDEHTHRIGIRPTKNASDEGALKFIHRGKNSNIYSRRFFDCFGIAMQKMKLHPSWDEKEKMIILELPK